MEITQEAYDAALKAAADKATADAIALKDAEITERLAGLQSAKDKEIGEKESSLRAITEQLEASQALAAGHAEKLTALEVEKQTLTADLALKSQAAADAEAARAALVAGASKRNDTGAKVDIRTLKTTAERVAAIKDGSGHA